MVAQTYLKARQFIYRNARPIDLTRFQYHFENGTKKASQSWFNYHLIWSSSQSKCI